LLKHQEDVAVTACSRIFWSAVVGWATMGMTHALTGQEPARLGVDGESPQPAIRGLGPQLPANQQMASAIADQLRQSGQLRHYTIHVAYQDGTAELCGTVADPLQRDEAVRLVQGIPGVERVRDLLTLTSRQTPGNPVEPAQAVTPGAQEPGPMPQKNPAANGKFTEPLPIFQAPPPGPYDVTQPKMPPYAWPTYAPYNNYSRVATPQLYPYQSWPFIGPCYPFPKIPLGWRKVKLEWQDGYWWYSKHANSHDWWTLRYW
jgi:BON domain